MLFPVSGVEVHPLIPILVALLVSFFTSMGGVSGAFLLLPFQVSVLGYTSPSVSATNQVFNIVAIPSGIYRYLKDGKMLFPLSFWIIIGTLPGVFIGAWVRVVYLPNPRNFKLFASFILIYIGYRLFTDLIKKHKSFAEKSPLKATTPSKVVTLESSIKLVRFSYNEEIHAFKPVFILMLCFFVGIIGGIYGIGGGSIISPFLVTFFTLPVYAVAGAALSGTFATSIAGVLFYHFLAAFYPDLNVSPDWLLGCLFGVGGLVGMYLGARAQKYVSAGVIKGILCFCILFVAGKYLLGFFA